MNVMYIDAQWRSYSLYTLLVVSEFGLLFLPFSPICLFVVAVVIAITVFIIAYFFLSLR